MSRLSFVLHLLALSAAWGGTVLPLTFADRAGKTRPANGVVISDDGQFVSVVGSGQVAASVRVTLDGAERAADVLSYDTTTGLFIGRVPDFSSKGPYLMAASTSFSPGDLFTASGRGAAFAGWGRMRKGRIFPLALMIVNYPEGLPLPGTPVLNAEGQVIAFSHQPVGGEENRGFALPAEVAMRAVRQLAARKSADRTWIGIVMQPDNSLPVIDSVRPNSPAQNAGLKDGDILLRFDGKEIANYTEAVDALYYLTAGDPVETTILRGVNTLQTTVVPVARSSKTLP